MSKHKKYNNDREGISVKWKDNICTFYLGDPDEIGFEAEQIMSINKWHLPELMKAVRLAIAQAGDTI